MKYWLVKSEPGAYSFDDQKKENICMWDGVRNYQAANNLKAMKVGNLVLFYHSIHGKEVVGLVRVAREYYPDPTDASGRFVVVDMKYEKPFETPVTLAQIKQHPVLCDIPLVKQSRLSVMPIEENDFHEICRLGGVEAS